MNLKDQLKDDMKTAMREKDRAKVTAIRSVLAEIQSMEIDKHGELSEDDFITILNRMVAQRRESIDQFKKADRQDLVDVEEAELGFLAPYLPEQLSDEEVLAIIDEVLAETGASEMKDMGKVMTALRPKLHGKADMGEANKIVRSRLG